MARTTLAPILAMNDISDISQADTTTSTLTCSEQDFTNHSITSLATSIEHDFINSSIPACQRRIHSSQTPCQPTEDSRIQEEISELQAVIGGFKKLLKPSSAEALVGEQLEARHRKALANLEKRTQALSNEVKTNAVTIMGLQRQKAVRETVVVAKFGEAKDGSKAFWQAQERDAYKRKFGHVESDDHEDGNEIDNEDEDEDGYEGYGKYRVFRKGNGGSVRNGGKVRRGTDESTLTDVFEEVKWLVENNPKCTGNTPIGAAFDAFRKLIKKKPGSKLDDDTEFLATIVEQAENMVTQIPLDGSKGIPGSFRRIRQSLL